MTLHLDQLRPDRQLLASVAQRALADRFDAATLKLAPSFSAAVFDADGVVTWVGHGHQRRDAARPARGTVYRIASMSKSFLGAAALQARDAGLLDMHAPVTEYVPEFASATYAGQPAHVTLEMLMSNRGGLAEDNPWGDNHLGASRAQISAVLAAGLRLALPPDTTYQYSNLGISLVGRALERVTGQPVEQVITERLLHPLGLTQTTYDPPQHDVATGWRTFDEGATWAAEPFVGCGALGCIGALFSTVDDIAAWAGFLRSAFTADPAHEDVLSAASRREMQRVHTVIPGIDERLSQRPLSAAGYGYGLVIEHHRRLGLTVQHSGGLPGFTSHMRWHVDSGVGVVVFGNSDAVSAAGVAIDVHDRLLDELVLQPAQPSAAGRRGALAAQLRPWPETLSAARRLDEIVQALASSADSTASISDLADVYAPNMLTDAPAAVRDQRIHAAAAALGGTVADVADFADRVIDAPTAACLRWRVPARHGWLICDVRLVGLSTPLVQAFSVSPTGKGDDADQTKPANEPVCVTDRFAATL